MLTIRPVCHIRHNVTYLSVYNVYSSHIAGTSGPNCMKTRKKHAVNKKKSTNILEVDRKDVTLHRNSEINLSNIGIWCNGNTADSGPAFPGSSPGIPTKRNLLHGKFLFIFSTNCCSICRKCLVFARSGLKDNSQTITFL